MLTFFSVTYHMNFSAIGQRAFEYTTKVPTKGREEHEYKEFIII